MCICTLLYPSGSSHGDWILLDQSRIQNPDIRKVDRNRPYLLRVVQEVEENGNWDCRDLEPRVLRGVESGKQERLSLQDSTRTKTSHGKKRCSLCGATHHRQYKIFTGDGILIHRLHCRTLIMHYKSHIVYEDFDTSS